MGGRLGQKERVLGIKEQRLIMFLRYAELNLRCLGQKPYTQFCITHIMRLCGRVELTVFTR